MSADPLTRPPTAHPTACAGFWLWALVGAGIALGFVSLAWFALAPSAAVASLVARRPQWRDGPALFGLLSGAGLALVVIGALNGNSHAWGGAGLCLLVAGMAAFAAGRRRGGS